LYTIVYDGDSDDDSERYVVGHLEEQVEGAEVISASSPLGAALVGASVGELVTYEAPNGQLSVRVLAVESI
jgi:transcription elongation factor GreA